MKSVYIYCPASSYTGGPTLAHQLCASLIEIGVNAKMWYDCYPIKKPFINPVHENYKQFNLPFVKYRPKDTRESVIILLESSVLYLWKFKKAKCYVWWMSVDNYFMNMGSTLDAYKKRLGRFKYSLQYGKDFESKHQKKYSIIQREDVTHLVQSEYAREFLLSRHIAEERIFDLGDYLEEELLNVKLSDIPSKSGKKVLYNPKKGYEFTQLIKEAAPECEWIPLINMNKSQVRDNLLQSKLYIDFGNHPGKDRFPREAIMCGCCIITGKRGAAKNNIDIPILDQYKFEDTEESIPRIKETIRDIIDNYEENYKNFLDYRERTSNEKQGFKSQVKELFEYLCD